jgi:hypothetical protein
VVAHGFPKCPVGRHPSSVERRHIELDETTALLLGDPQAAVHADQVGEADLA